MTKQDFDEWLKRQDMSIIPLVAWGNSHTEIAVRFAQDMAARAVRRTLGEALNSGDGSYRP